MLLPSKMGDDFERREMELQALRSIFADELEEVSEKEWRLTLTAAGHPTPCHLEILLPDDYPSTSAPTPLLFAPAVGDEVLRSVALELEAIYDGNEVVYEWVEHLKERLLPLLPPWSDAGRTNDDSLSESLEAVDLHAVEVCGASDGFTFIPETRRFKQRTRHFGAHTSAESNAVHISHGDPTTPPGKSTFQGHLAAVSSVAQVEWVLRHLLEDRRIARASHNIYAYRFWDSQRNVQVSDNDDDGEAAAGRQVAALLELMGANDVLVVVSRWYGGVHLGPDRFRYISNAARQLLEQHGYNNGINKSQSGPAKGKSAKASRARAG